MSGVARIGLVLGAGGLVGQAYEAGVLTAIEQHLGWDPRRADLLVGTSAGAVTASLLRLGVGAADLAAWAVHAPLSVEGEPLMARLGDDARAFPPLRPWPFLRPPRLPRPALLARLLTRPCAVRPGVAAATLLHAGSIDIAERVHRLDGLIDDTWPEGLLVCAARRDDGRRVTFGREGRPRVDLADAVAASCAIPGFFAPVRIAGIEYFDGGVHSTTNADVLAGAEVDVVVVVAPMSAAHGRAATLDGLWRLAVHRRIERELRALRQRGVEIVRVEPGHQALGAMGLNAMADERAERVVRAAFLETTARAQREPVSTRLAVLSRPPAPFRRPAARPVAGA